MNSPEFATLPVHFAERNETVDRGISAIFPWIPDQMHLTAQFALAALVYHAPFLRATLPATHRLFSTPLFTDRSFSVKEIGDQLPTIIHGRKSPLIQGTGIPPHINHMCALVDVQKEIAAFIPALESATSKVIDGVGEMLEERSVYSPAQGCKTFYLRCYCQCRRQLPVSRSLHH